MTSLDNSWSDWLDYNSEVISNVPQVSGVFMMHAAMKILLISDSDNLREGLTETIKDPCLSNATRFRFMPTDKHEKTKEDLIKNYQEKHDGNMPKCMQ